MAVGEALQPAATLLALATLLDLLIGDPVYSIHPVRLIGTSVTTLEKVMRKLGLDGYAGGIFLFLLVSLLWIGGASALLALFWQLSRPVGMLMHLFLLYSLLALGDLLRHVSAVNNAATSGDLERARSAIAKLVGRDTARMDVEACRRAAIESLSENLPDGFIGALLWYTLAGIPGLVLFKVVSTMDSMVGYKDEQYLRFGWCGARMDDLMNWLPARGTWLLLSVVATVVPRCSARKALLCGWKQHSVLPGPNPGWSEATMAGALQRRLVGPIWRDGELVTNVWIGYEEDPPAGEASDVRRALWLAATTGLAAAGFSTLLIQLLR